MEPSLSQVVPPPQTPFFHRPAVQQFLPFATSLVFHLGVILLAVLLYKTVDAVRQAITREQIIIPDTNLVENADNGGVPNPGINDDPTRAAAQSNDENVKASKDWADQKSPTLTQSLMSGSADVAADVTPIGAGATAGGVVSGLKTNGIGEEGGNLAPFGPPGGGGGQGKGLFGIPGGNVKRVAYVCDASGSLFGSRALNLIKQEMRESVGRLRTSQAFSILFFRGTDVPPIVLNGANTLQFGTPKNKEAAYKLIEDLEVKGDTDPREALKLAFGMKPEMVFLLIDGVESSVVTPESLAKQIDTLNVGRKVRLTVIVVGKAEQTALQPFEDLAKANGGELRRVTER
jgi:hypothetical protein